MSNFRKYVGKFFFDLYHGMGINFATLTGAIDVIIIEQPDGTFNCSPFHVRFGKLGVLRSREKIVDMEINGEPVDLHMKLGEAGEAFFVQELEPESRIPEYLATSPLPATDELMKQGVLELRRQSTREGGHTHTTDENVQVTDDKNGRGYPAQPRMNFSVINENSNSKHRRRRKRNNQRSSSPPSPGKLSSSLNVSSEIFEMDVDSSDEDSYADRKYSSSTPAAAAASTVGVMAGPPSDEECSMTRTQSWAESQFDSVGHAFSDSEVMPDTDRLVSRPMSPMSDSGMDHYAMNDASLIHCDETTLWEWGDLPKTPVIANKSLPALVDPHGSPKSLNSKDSSTSSSKPSGRRQPLPKEGLYLDDLMNEEMDPEIAKLYFPKSTFDAVREHDEDTESGRGPSLPHSPHSVEGAIGGPPVSYLKSEVDSLGAVAMSLCGGLSDGTTTLESFMQKIVSYDELSTNPTLISNPDLVLRVEEKFYNWATAAPMILCHSVFHRDLPTETVQSLIKDNMPKKRKSGMSSWFSWRRPAPDQQPATDTSPSSPITMATTQHFAQEPDDISNKIQSDVGQVQSAPSSLSSSPKKQNPISNGSLPQAYDDALASDPDTDSSDKGGVIHVAEDGRVYQKTLRLTSEQIKDLRLRPGANMVTFSVTTQYQGTSRCMSHIYLWRHSDKIVISDIDGTITKSDVLGHILPILPIVGRDWSQSGVAELYTKIRRNGYRIVYLSARAIGMSRSTKDLLKSIKQDNILLPEGPILLSPTSLIRAFHREVIEKRSEDFKIQCLSDIGELFPSDVQPFYAGFGNRINDVCAYKALNIPQSHIFTINYSGQLRQSNLLTFQSTYHEMCDTVDHFFPPYSPDLDSSKSVLERRYSSPAFWRDPLPDVEGFNKLAVADDNDDAVKNPVDAK